MNDPLDRLLHIAAKAPAQPAASPSYGLETRVLAAWRAMNSEDEGAGWLSAFRPAIIIAGTAMVLSVFFNFAALSDLRERVAYSTSEVTVVDSALRLAFER